MSQPTPTPPGDMLVRRGLVVDGTGADGRPADVRIRDGVIAEIAPDLKSEGESELDADGAIVAPGFIDAHTHYDPSLWWEPTCDPMAVHGVTTAVIGNCSLSLAPLRPEHRPQLTDMFCFIEDMPNHIFETDIPWTWQGFGEYTAAQNARGSGVQLVPLVGHSLLRLFVMGDESFERAARPDERAQIGALLADCLAGGAFGLSTSFNDVDQQGRLVPSRLADDAEFAALAAVFREAGRGVVEFHPVFADLDENLANIERIHTHFGDCAPGTWTQLAIGPMNAANVKPLLEQAERTQREGVGVFPQVSPRPFDVYLEMESTGFFAFLPTWHAFVSSSAEERRAQLANEDWRAKARKEWDETEFSLFPHRFPEKIRFLSGARPEHQPFVGGTLADLIAARGGHPCDVFADWVAENDLLPSLMVLGLANGEPAEVADLLASDAIILGGGDAGAHVQSLCGAGDTSLVLSLFCRDRGDLSIERAVKMLTSDVARIFGVRDRGVLAPGLAGDLTVFSLDAIHYPGDERVADLPDGSKRLTRPGGGYRATVVSGVPTQLEGKATPALPGRMLDPTAGRS